MKKRHNTIELDAGQQVLMWSEFTGGMRNRTAQRRELVKLLPSGGLPSVIGALLVQVVAGILPVAFVLVVSQVIATVPDVVEDGVESPAWHEMRTHLAFLAATFLGVQLLIPVQLFFADVIRRKIDAHVRDRVMSASFGADGIGALEDPEVVDEAVNALGLMRVDMWTPGAACSGLIALLSRYLQTLSAAVVTSVVLVWWAGLALLLAALTIRFGYRLGLSVFGRVFRAHSRSQRRRLYFRDLLMGAAAAKEIRVFGLLPWVRERYAQAAMASLEPVWRERRRIFYGPYVVYTLVAFALLASVFGVAMRASATGVIGIGALMIVTQASLSAIRIGGYIPESDAHAELGTLAYQRVRRYEQLVAPPAGRSGAGIPEQAARSELPSGFPLDEIRFQQVSFRYTPDGPLVFDRLDLTIAAGRSLAVVGLNGAGKTTLVKLLARLYEPTSGVITADGVDIRTLPVDLWQRRIAAIFQDFLRFELPVRDNVAFGAVELLGGREATDAAVHTALERVGAAGFVARLPRGLDTPLSRQYSEGTDLSGGQWQRIAMARALVAVKAGARVLVLDEPTASLDVRAEVAFFKRFLELTQGVTSLVISHRFSTVRKADRIVVLEHGGVIEEGTHDQLLAREGRYAELFRIQAARFSTEPVAGSDIQLEGRHA